MYEEMQMQKWREERDKAVLSLNLARFKKFYEKWQKIGIYDMPLPTDDKVIEIAMRKEILIMKNPPKKKLEQAKAWLTARGYSITDWSN